MAETIPFPAQADDVEPVRFEYAGADPDGAVRDLGGVYDGRHLLARRTAAEFGYRYTAIGDTDLTIRRSQMHGLMRGVVPPSDDHVVTWMTDGSGDFDVDGIRVDLPVDEPMLVPAGCEVVFAVTDSDQRFVHLDRDFVQRIAAVRFALDDRPLRFDPRRAPVPEALRPWQGALAALTRALRSAGPESAEWDAAKTAAVQVFLDMFPPQLDRLPAVLGLAKNARLRAAVEHVHAHAAEDVTVAELSAVAGLSVRSVQESFRRVFDVSPLTYLRQVRLDRVRDELLMLDPSAGAVGDVARRWGFAHLGRFSAAYHERFGEYPKQTLRR
ncbi:helix-turn-helix domain-containing protein [Curtobacterium sp. ISL-83]|uniref:AraC family transcriptional regulator n=1 Tax=Curtobacterium sp. ISL-83 TaxID=2819145 RepID=UPI001BE7E7D3|nr:helix-turn-helix domain-containing protein [Curtobacterium sp. ISL-83]MBT2501281.1 AraC family transcriptional regulator [Curtobacterium sp. ISL-83]